jgi:tripartite-type tricarboxylate transporter receptor subunit TctC
MNVNSLRARLLAAALALTAGTATAAFPDKPIKVVVANPPGRRATRSAS